MYLVPLDVKIYRLPANNYAVSRLHYIRLRTKSKKHSVIIWRYGFRQPIKHLTKSKFDTLVAKYSLVEE